jgi:hypothetical protein
MSGSRSAGPSAMPFAEQLLKRIGGRLAQAFVDQLVPLIHVVGQTASIDARTLHVSLHQLPQRLRGKGQLCKKIDRRVSALARSGRPPCSFDSCGCGLGGGGTVERGRNAPDDQVWDKAIVPRAVFGRIVSGAQDHEVLRGNNVHHLASIPVEKEQVPRCIGFAVERAARSKLGI